MSLSLLISVVVGSACGILGGATPGMSSAATLALMLPFTFGMQPLPAIVLLGAAYTGAQYGGSITATLFNTPGSPESAVMAIEGFPLTRQGRARYALGGAIWAGLIGGLIGVALLILFTPLLTAEALKLGPPEYAMIGILGFTVIGSLTRGSIAAAFLAGFFGMLIAAIGIDPIDGARRMTFGSSDLVGGIPLVPALVGLFAISEAFHLLTAAAPAAAASADDPARQSRTGFSLRDLAANWRYVLTGAAVGAFVGVKPGGGATIASWLSYSAARAVAGKDDRARVGRGMIGGLLAPEAADKASVGAALIPLLGLGIPASASAAVILGAFELHNLIPGPLLFAQQTPLVEGLFGGLLAANVVVALMGWGLIAPMLRVRRIDAQTLAIVIVVLATLGAYADGNSGFNVLVAVTMGALGFLLRRAAVPLPPIVLGMIIGPIIEVNVRRSLILGNGTASLFFTRPVSLALLIAAAILFVVPIAARVYAQRLS